MNPRWRPTERPPYKSPRMSTAGISAFRRSLGCPYTLKNHQLVFIIHAQCDHVAFVTRERRVRLQIGVLVIERDPHVAPNYVIDSPPGEPGVVNSWAVDVIGMVKTKPGGQRPLPP